MTTPTRWASTLLALLILASVVGPLEPASALAARHVLEPSESTVCEEVGSSPLEACSEWMARFDHTSRSPTEPAGDFAGGIATSPDGETIFVTGRLRWDSTDHDVITAAYEADTGKELWTARTGGPDYDYGYDILASPAGDIVYVASFQRISGEFVHVTLAYRTGTGELLWEGPVEPAGIHSVVLASAPDGSHLLSAQSAPEGDTRLLALDSETGQIAWESRHAIELPAAIDVGSIPDGDGGHRRAAFVTGRIMGEQSGFDHATAAIDLEAGALLWRSTYSSPGAGHDESRDVAVSEDGTRVITAGWVTGPDGRDAAVVAYDARTGQRVWDRTYDGPDSQIDQFGTLVLSPDGGTAFASGQSWNVFARAEGVGQLYDASALTIAYDTVDGSTEWLSRVHGPAGSLDNWSDSSIHPAGSRLYLIGVVGTIPTTRALDARSGGEIWTRRAGGTEGAIGSPREIVTGPEGERVYVTGSWVGSGYYDLVTLAYTA